jgi:hypothetical protein
MTTDFKAALEWIKDQQRNGYDICTDPYFNDGHLETAILALKLADRLIGEPSDEVMDAMYNSLESKSDINGYFKAARAMRDQLLKECGE